MHFTLIEAGTQEAGDIRSELESLGKEKVMKRLTAVTMLAGSFVVAALLIPTTAEAAHGNNGRNSGRDTGGAARFERQQLRPAVHGTRSYAPNSRSYQHNNGRHNNGRYNNGWTNTRPTNYRPYIRPAVNPYTYKAQPYYYGMFPGNVVYYNYGIRSTGFGVSPNGGISVGFPR